MALLTAFLPTDMTNLGLTSIAGNVAGYLKSTNVTYNGVTYASALQIVYQVGGVYYDLILAGTGLTYAPLGGSSYPVITGGTVTGVLLQKYTGGSFVPDVYIQNISVSAATAESVLLGTSNTADISYLESAVFSSGDIVVGYSSGNTLVGYGSNTIFGVVTAGGNSITGTAGSNNTVAYTGKFNQYTIIQNTGSFTVTYNGTGGGTDTLTDIQTLVFSDRTVTVSSLPIAANVLASQAAGEQANAAVTSFTVADTAANVAAALAALGADSKLTTITLTDSGTPFLELSTAQQSAYAAGLAKITSSYTLVAPVTISNDGGTYLVQLNTEYALQTSAYGSGPLLNISGSPVTTAQLGGYVAVGAVAVTGGYDVALRSQVTGQFVIWNVNSQGTYVSTLAGVIAPTSLQLENFETVFGQDLNVDGTTGVKTTVLSTDYGTVFESVGNTYGIIPSGGTAVTLKYIGTAVTTGEFGSYNPIGAVVFVNGYEVAFRSSADGSVVFWQTDANGNFLNVVGSVLASGSTTLEAAEASFNQDLNADGTLGVITTKLDSNAGTVLETYGNQFEIQPSGGSAVTLRYNGAAVTAGQFGDYNPARVVSVSGAYEVAFKSASTGAYVIWYVDSAGNYTGLATGLVSGSSAALEAQESVFNEDLNGDGTVGTKTTTIYTSPGASLLQIGNSFLINSTYSSSQFALTYNGTAVTVGSIGDYTPTAVATVSTGFIVVFTSASTGNIVVWNVNSSGAFTSLRTGLIPSSSQTLQALETSVYSDLNGDGAVGSNGSTSVVVEETQYSYLINSSYTSIALQYGGSYLNAGALGSYHLTAAVKVTGGFDVAFRSSSTGDFVIWNVDSNGNFVKLLTGDVLATSSQLEGIETIFNRDLNGDGTIGVTTQSIGTANGTTLSEVANAYVINQTTTPETLQLNGTAVAVGQFGSYAPTLATAVQGGFDVLFKETGVDSYVVWRTDASGNYQGLLTGVVTGESFAIEQLQSTFKVAIAGDTALRSAVLTGVSSADFTSNPTSTTVSLLNNSAFANFGGLSQTGLVIVGTPGAVNLATTSTDTIEFTMAQASGIETINNFRYGQDELNIDLNGAASSTLQVSDTSLNGSAAISIYSSADPYNGVVLTGLGTGMNAANLQFGHTTFAGGHAIIT